MALKKPNSGQTPGNLLIVRTATRDENKHDIPATFIALEKVGDKWVKKDNFSQISGDIKSLELVEDKYEGNVKYIAKFLLSDEEAGEAYLLDLRFNILNRSLFNKIMGLQSPNNVSISVYNNKKGYADASIRQNDELVKWKFDWQDVPRSVAITHPKNGKVIQNDFTEVDDFYLENLEKWARELNIYKTKKEDGATGSAPQEERPEPSPEQVEVPASQADSSDLW